MKQITVGRYRIQKDEAEVIIGLNSEVAHTNPDLILTEKGDSFELPYLHHRASLHDIDLPAWKGEGFAA